MMKMRHPLFALLILSMVIVSFGYKVKDIYKWNIAEFKWLSKEHKEDALRSGIYDPTKCMIEDANEAEDGRLFITVTNINEHASPASLTTVTNMTELEDPILEPYPDWKWYNNSCNGITNVYRVDIKCNHIFVLDSGKIGTDQICDPKLLIFDLKDDTLVKTINILHHIATNKSGSGLLIKPLIYIPNGECTQFLDEMIVFIADSGGSGLIVYDSSTKRMCRVESDYMKPTDTSFSILSKSFTYEGGIFSLTILYDDLYFAPVSGKEIYKINIKELLKCPDKEVANKYTQLVKELSSQTIDLTSAGQSIFYNDFSAMSILRTKVSKQLNTTYKTEILAQDSEKFQSVASMKISSNGCQLKCISDRFQCYHTLNPNEINFRYFEIELC
ncbi:PREDICTED: major royal jelly protein 3-like [Cyphomyrmex costatus]|uniref:major royal jelly protein 3-like n=1 Tax=Cyphomyrmex costatus TaxID=456900 RepID=UPI00085232D0|nr:PREDICTED: major royal jelly protein 3-like [Cyphomyrmex costatus]